MSAMTKAELQAIRKRAESRREGYMTISPEYDIIDLLAEEVS